MAKPHAVTDTSPVITLVGIGELRLFDALFERVVVPFEVWGELTDKPGSPEPDALRAIQVVAFLPAPPAPVETVGLHAGEIATIALAHSIQGAWALLDEIAARRVANSLRLQVKGTLGILVEAKRQGIVPTLRPLLDRMMENGCRLAPDLVAAVLRAVNE